ncbi:MAG: kelch repeat-containing protein [Candidatus Sumerlaeaceae bacterium]
MTHLFSFSAVHVRTIKHVCAAGLARVARTAAVVPAILRSDRVRQAFAAGLLVAAALATTPASAQNLAWMKGSNSPDQAGTYGTQGAAAAENTPGAREGSVSWADASGNLWLFGGYGYNAAGVQGRLNDLWKYDVASGNWTWMKGSNAVEQVGTYGTQGTADAVNSPGARQGSVSWTDTAGALWLFGGFGSGAASLGNLNDLWKYDVASGNWTWMKGSNAVEQVGTYGTQGTAAAANTPGARNASVSWTDASGILWLCGGYGKGVFGVDGALNDLWKYDVASGNWTWIKGSMFLDEAGIYGTQGTADPANTPGARYGSVSWTDASGNLWLFGGYGYGTTASQGRLNDLWKYDVASGNWTWMKGSTVIDQVGTYGTQGTAAPANTPGTRQYPVSWTDASGNFWLFGGSGYGATASFGYPNDLWKYDVASGNWTWMKGSNVINQAGTYGTQGTAAVTNIPGGREASTGRRGPANTLYLFGGYGNGAAAFQGGLNDLWAIYLNPSVSGAPVISSIAFNSPSTLDVTYNEAMPGSALLASNYTLSGPEMGTLAAQPDSVTWISGNTYRLTWNTGSNTGDHVTITVPSTMTDVTGEAFGANGSYTLPVSLSRFSID